MGLLEKKWKRNNEKNEKELIEKVKKKKQHLYLDYWIALWNVTLTLKKYCRNVQWNIHWIATIFIKTRMKNFLMLRFILSYKVFTYEKYSFAATI